MDNVFYLIPRIYKRTYYYNIKQLQQVEIVTFTYFVVKINNTYVVKIVYPTY